MSKKILLIGSDEIIGESLNYYFTNNTDYEVVNFCTDKKFDGVNGMMHLDILNREQIKEMCIAAKPNYILNVAEITDIDDCEADKKTASDLNTILTQYLVRIANIVDSKYIGISSDMIFDGIAGNYKEESRPEPINYFGRTKHAAENAIRSENIPWTIIRTSQPIGFSRYNKKDELKSLVDKFQKNQNIYASTDVIRTPIFAEDFAEAITRVIETEKTGIFHIAGQNTVSAFEFANTVAEVFNFSKEKILNQHKNLEHIPLKCGLNCTKAIEELQIDIPSALSAIESIAFMYKQYKLI